MSKTAESNRHADIGHSRVPLGGFLDDLPNGLYALAHLGFLAAGAWLWMRASASALPYSGALALYVVSQVGFLAYFAHGITMKAAVLAEQTLVLALVLLVVLRTT